MILSRQLASVCGRVVGFELCACVQTTDHHCSAAGSESSRRTAPHGPACRPAAPSQSALCLYFVIFSSSYYRISSVFTCVCAPPSIRILLPSVAHQLLYPWVYVTKPGKYAMVKIGYFLSFFGCESSPISRNVC